MRANLNPSWVDVAGVDDILPGTGEACLLAGRQIAIFRVRDNVYATDNYDPYSRANVMARGIVGCRGGEPKVASPMYKQSFCLRTGVCFDDPSVALEVFPVRLERNRILVWASVTNTLQPRNIELLHGGGA